MVHRYSICGLTLECERPFVTPLPSATGQPVAGQVVRFAELATPPAEPTRWLFERTFEGDEQPWLSVARLERGYLLRVHDEADFWVDERGSEIGCAAEPGCAPASVEQMLLDHILPQVLHLRGQPCLHASAVALAGTVVAFVGRSGSGKSTLAASFPDALLVSDDCLVAMIAGEQVLVEPSYPSVRLWQQTADALQTDGATAPPAAPRSRKVRLALPPARGPLPLRGIYLLEERQGAPTLARLRLRDAVVRLAEHLQRLDPSDRERLTQELAFLGALVTRAPVSVLRYPRSYEQLDAVRTLVAADQQGSRGQ